MPSKLRNLVKKISLAFLYSSPPLPQRLHGKMIWIHPRARFSVSTKTFFKGEPHVRKWLTEHLKPGHVFFDVGAHHGWISLWALPLVGQEGAVHSFEPSPANLTILGWHRNHNKFSQWTLVPAAVSDEDVSQKDFFLIDSGDSPMNSLTSGVPDMPLMEGRNVEKTTIRSITLDSYCQQAALQADLLKIDVEGAELLVLRGALKLIRESFPTIILAVHPYWLPAGQSPTMILKLLEANGYAVFDAKGKAVDFLSSGEYLCKKRSEMS